MNRLRVFSVPYWIWTILLIALPTIFLVVLAFSDYSLYNPDNFTITLKNFQIFSQPYVFTALKNSFTLSLITSLICFIIGYPVAYYLSTFPDKTRKIMLSLLIVPLWANMLLRIFAWEKIFTPDTIFFDIFRFNIDLLGTKSAVVIGMVGMYLPFMIFPIFSVLEKMDKNLIEAAKDLGATDFKVFLKVVFPLSVGGVVSGVIMTMLPSMTSFVLPARIGLGRINLIGNIIESKFMREVMGSAGSSINVGSLVSILIMLVSVAAFVMITKVDKEGETLI